MDEVIEGMMDCLPQYEDTPEIRGAIRDWLAEGNDNGEPFPDLAMRFDEQYQPDSRE